MNLDPAKKFYPEDHRIQNQGGCYILTKIYSRNVVNFPTIYTLTDQEKENPESGYAKKHGQNRRTFTQQIMKNRRTSGTNAIIFQFTCLVTLSWTELHCCLGTVMQSSSSLSKHFCSATVVVMGLSTVMHLGRVTVLHSRRGTAMHSCLQGGKKYETSGFYTVPNQCYRARYYGIKLPARRLYIRLGQFV